MRHPLAERLPTVPTASGALLDLFLDYVNERKVTLYPAQEEAILELFSNKNVILNTPTGSGKSLVATAVHFKSMAEGKRSIYTSPIKALVNEKFLALCRDFGPEQVGMITGDATVNSTARIICCTAEILAVDGLRYGSKAPIDDVVIDEFHYYSDRERGVAWQIPLLTLPQSRFLLMSATLGDTSPFESALSLLTGRETVVVKSTDRPVPLDFRYEELPLHETIARLIQNGRAPVYIVNFTQRETAEVAQDLLSVDFCSKEEKRAIGTALEGVDFGTPYGKEIQKLLKHGIGLHYGGLLPRYRVLVERLAQNGLLKIICGTDTLGVGVNIPIRTVLFTKLCKFDGEKTGLLSVRDFKQISGRAGRKGFDDLGTVVAQAPEHVIENIRNEQKAAGDAKKIKKLVKRKPPEKGYVAWSKETFDKLVQGEPESLISRFQINHGMLLNVLSREHEDGCRAMQRLIRDCHESDHAKKRLGKLAFQLFRSLVEREIITLQPKLAVHADLQADFSLNQTLSLYLIDTIKLLDPSHPDYALDLLSLVESILEDPDLILRKQLDRAKTEKMAELKASGMEFDQRIEELEKLEYPKPNREFIYTTFNEFSRKHPWVGQENIRPKSVAREMHEMFLSFTEYVREYELQRTEGLLLRYITDVYKVLAQTVPDYAKNDDIRDMTTYFGSMVRQIDSSLIDEWERLRNPAWIKSPENAPIQPHATPPEDLTREIRNEIFRLVRELARRDLAAILQLARVSTTEEVETALSTYFDDHSRILTDTPSRASKHTRIEKPVNDSVRVQQTLCDPESHNDWAIDILVDLENLRFGRRPALKLERISPI